MGKTEAARLRAKPKARKAAAKASRPGLVVEPEIERSIREGRIQSRDLAVEYVVSTAVRYHAETQRDDAAHRARLSKRWHDLYAAIIRCAEADQRINRPITQEDVDHEMLMRAFLEDRREDTGG